MEGIKPSDCGSYGEPPGFSRRSCPSVPGVTGLGGWIALRLDTHTTPQELATALPPLPPTVTKSPAVLPEHPRTGSDTSGSPGSSRFGNLGYKLVDCSWRLADDTHRVV